MPFALALVCSVLDARPAALKLALDQVGGVDVPIYVQWYTAYGIHAYDHKHQPSSMTGFPDGEPHCVDACTLAPFREMRTRLVVYVRAELSDACAIALAFAIHRLGSRRGHGAIRGSQRMRCGQSSAAVFGHQAIGLHHMMMRIVMLFAQNEDILGSPLRGA